MIDNNVDYIPKKNMICTYNFKHFFLKCKNYDCFHYDLHNKDDECKTICPNGCTCANIDSYQLPFKHFIVDEYLLLRSYFLVVLSFVNFFLLQFFCVRLAVKFRHPNVEQISSIVLLTWVTPLTGWNIPILKHISNGKIEYQSCKTLVYISSLLGVRIHSELDINNENN
jgi:hypothetical protein